jgi:hypothetical protein
MPGEKTSYKANTRRAALVTATLAMLGGAAELGGALHGLPDAWLSFIGSIPARLWHLMGATQQSMVGLTLAIGFGIVFVRVAVSVANGISSRVDRYFGGCRSVGGNGQSGADGQPPPPSGTYIEPTGPFGFTGEMRPAVDIDGHPLFDENGRLVFVNCVVGLDAASLPNLLAVPVYASWRPLSPPRPKKGRPRRADRNPRPRNARFGSMLKSDRAKSAPSPGAHSAPYPRTKYAKL